MTNANENELPSPALFLQTVGAFQRSAAIKAAIELDVFTLIGKGAHDVAALSAQSGAAERGLRILCDYLAIQGFLAKDGAHYTLTPDAAMFCDRRSMAYMGDTVKFLQGEEVQTAFSRLTEAVRAGGTALDGQGSMEPEHPMWVEFARAMRPMMQFPAEMIAGIVGAQQGGDWKVLDIAAGHGAFGIALARHNPRAQVTALDWKAVLEVAKENARAAGVQDRYHALAGSAFDVDYGSEYDIVLLTNFLHHFDVPTCEAILRKVQAALKPGGRALTLEFVPDDGRRGPPPAVEFALTMLATTERGDAYTFAELEKMHTAAGFGRCELHDLHPSPQRLVVATK